MVSADGFSGVLYQLFIVSPAISWILQPGRFSRQRGFFYAVSFLTLLAAFTIGQELYQQESNFYHVVGAPRDAPLSDIKRAFRLRSVELHPDKNPSPTAVEEFNRLRLAFDVLGDAHKRSLYDVYGEGAVEKETQAAQIEMVIGLLSFYALWSVLTFVLTFSENAQEARAWSFAGGLLLFILEINLVFGRTQLPTQLFPYMTVYEFTRIVRSAFPPFMNGCRAIGGFYFHNMAHENFALGIELLKSNRAILLSMRQLQGEVASASRRRPEPSKVVKPDALPAAARKRLKMEKHPAATASSAVPTTSAAEPTGEATSLTLQEQELLNPSPSVATPPAFEIPRFVYFIGFYVVMNYFFS